MNDACIQPKPAKNNRELRITGVPNDLRRIVKNAANYYGVDQASFLKQALRKIVDELPPKIREFQRLD